jgi:dipeptidyl aminopeptidase/acylaminoacyl peptidase
MLLADGDVAEILPYVNEGFAVLAYELDGPYHGGEDGSDVEFRRAYDKFRAAKAGLVNSRNALQYVLSQVPEVDPARIYTAGHSSAADQALLLAGHESRLAGCIAYMPAYDNVQWLSPVAIRGTEFVLPGASDFAVKSSPSTHINNITCPVFLFHAEDDENVDVGIVRGGAESMNAAGVDVTFQTAQNGGHYYAMIEQGIPAGIQWLKELDAENR